MVDIDYEIAGLIRETDTLDRKLVDARELQEPFGDNSDALILESLARRIHDMAVRIRRSNRLYKPYEIPEHLLDQDVKIEG